MRCDARLADAQHEAAHVVVGVALGLRLRRATTRGQKVGGRMTRGHTRFDGRYGSIEAWAIMFAAGHAWEIRVGNPAYSAADLANMRCHGVRSAAAVRALEIAAWAVLEARAAAHARVTRALLAGDVTSRHVAALARGETPKPAEAG